MKTTLCTFGFLCLSFGCSFGPIDRNFVDSNSTVNGAEAAVKPSLSPADVACEKDYECMVIDMGCCPNEEASAVHRNKVLQLKRSVNHYCSPLRLAKEDLCRGKKANIVPHEAECAKQKCVVIK